MECKFNNAKHLQIASGKILTSNLSEQSRIFSVDDSEKKVDHFFNAALEFPDDTDKLSLVFRPPHSSKSTIDGVFDIIHVEGATMHVLSTDDSKYTHNQSKSFQVLQLPQLKLKTDHPVDIKYYIPIAIIPLYKNNNIL